MLILYNYLEIFFTINVISFKDNCKSPEPRTLKENWYHGTLGRDEAVAMINQAGNKDGSFLVRYSDRSEADILTMIHDQEYYHFQLQREVNKLYRL